MKRIWALILFAATGRSGGFFQPATIRKAKVKTILHAMAMLFVLATASHGQTPPTQHPSPGGGTTTTTSTPAPSPAPSPPPSTPCTGPGCGMR